MKIFAECQGHPRAEDVIQIANHSVVVSILRATGRITFFSEILDDFFRIEGKYGAPGIDPNLVRQIAEVSARVIRQRALRGFSVANYIS